MILLKRDFCIGRNSVPLEEQKKKIIINLKNEKKNKQKTKDCINVSQKDLLDLTV